MGCWGRWRDLWRAWMPLGKVCRRGCLVSSHSLSLTSLSVDCSVVPVWSFPSRSLCPWRHLLRRWTRGWQGGSSSVTGWMVLSDSRSELDLWENVLSPSLSLNHIFISRGSVLGSLVVQHKLTANMQVGLHNMSLTSCSLLCRSLAKVPLRCKLCGRHWLRRTTGRQRVTSVFLKMRCSTEMLEESLWRLHLWELLCWIFWLLPRSSHSDADWSVLSSTASQHVYCVLSERLLLVWKETRKNKEDCASRGGQISFHWHIPPL